MKVLHLITGLARGGAETALSRLVGAKDPGGIEHVVVSMLDEGAIGAEIRAAGVTVHALGMRPGRPSARGLWALRRLLRRERPDIVQTWLYHADLLGTVATRGLGGAPLVWNIRRGIAHREDYGKTLFALIRVLARLSRIPAAVIANSQAGRRAHEGFGYRPRRWAVIPNGVDTDRFGPDPEARDAVRREWGVGARERLVGFVGRLHTVKDPEGFLAAAGRIAKEVDDVRFVLVGDDPEGRRPALDRVARDAGVADRVVWAGPRSDMARVYNAFDLFALTSHSEGFPNVVVEAMATGLPCVVTDVGDAAEIVGPTGAVVPPRDPEALAREIARKLSRPPSESQAEGRAVRDRAVDRCSLGRMVREYAALYDSLVTGDRR